MELQTRTLANASIISPADVTSVDPTQWLRMGIQAVASSPCAATPLAVKVQWALYSLGFAATADSGSGLTVAVAPGRMTAGGTYVLRVVATARGNGYAVAYAAFAAVAAQAPVAILGGSRSVRAGANFTVSLDTQALQFAGLSWKSSPAVWSCLGDVPCPTQLSRAIADAGGRWFLSVDAGIPAGTSAVLQAAIGASNSATVTIIVASSLLPQLVFLTTPSRTSLLAGRAAFTVAVVNAPISSLVWTVCGEHVAYGTTAFATTNLQPGACTALVTATNDEGSSSAKVELDVPVPVTGDCTVSAVEPDAAVVGLTSRIVIAANFTSNAALRYRFGYVNARSEGGGVISLVPYASLKPSLQVVAPAVAATAAVAFVVEAVDTQTVQIIASCTCTAVVAFSADALTAAVASAGTQLASAAAAGDVDAATRVAGAMAVASGMTSLTPAERAAAAQSAVTAVSTMLNLTTQAAPLTRAGREALLGILQATLASSAAAVTGNADTAGTALDVAVAAVAPAAGANAAARATLDAATSASGALEVLSALRVVAPSSVAQAAITVAAALAAQAQVGMAPTTIGAPEYLVSGMAAPADESIRVAVTAGNASIRLPRTYAPGGAGQALSLAATAFAVDPFSNGTDFNGSVTVATEDAIINATRVSHVVDFAVRVDGVAHVVSNVPDIALTFNATGAAAAAILNGTTVAQCMYFDVASQKWSMEGIQQVSVVALGDVVVVTCNTTHLSYYALFAISAAVATPAPSSGSGSGAHARATSEGGLRPGALAAIGILTTLAAVGGVAAVVAVKRRGAARHALDPDMQDADAHETLLIVPEAASSCESQTVDGSQLSV
jgi:hypothetical protein